ncbi:MAG: NnrS family protein [Pseudomonadales bacterium]|nr:NnrS family protein [Pseudomonadales bacterium]
MKPQISHKSTGNAYHIFFAGAALHAMLIPVLFLCIRNGSINPPLLLTPGLWHAQEMIFGYAFIIIAGYLLTQVSPVTLFGLMLLWLSGRFIWFMNIGIPNEIIVLFASAFPLSIGWLAGTKFKAAKRLRNRIFSIILWGLGLLATSFYLLGYARYLGAAYQTIYLALYLIVLFIIIMGGRLIPPATIGALRDRGQEVRIPFQSTYETLCMALGGFLMLFELLPIPPFWKSLPALALGLILMLRLSAWRSIAVRRAAAVWPLHLGYFWMALGLTFFACARMGIIGNPLDALHLITLGGIGAITLSMIIRVSTVRGHRGELHPHWWYAIQGTLLSAILLRSSANSVQPYTEFLLWLSAGFWALAFLLFILRFYLPNQLFQNSQTGQKASPKE